LDFLYIKMEYMTEKSVKELDENYLTNFWHYRKNKYI
jgi:hypothetical protein